MTNVWKTAVALANPNGITRYSQRPLGVLKAVFYLSPSLMWKRLGLETEDQLALRQEASALSGGSVAPLRRGKLISILEVQLGEDGGPLKQFECGSHQGEGVPVLDRDFIDPSIVNAWSFFPMKKKPAPAGDDEGRMMPAARDSLR